ncbi:hypothetical protein EVAR_71727_1 [Eumeta japonica]|uniref:Uncharacterized protein n=1 Tax=Eumeta variegata TaxID=151549 RepID=A0A4C1SVZ8_EUMVA|nr:hypothetical protein EVAR_71727_1 [Eumeta japonica]
MFLWDADVLALPVSFSRQFFLEPLRARNSSSPRRMSTRHTAQDTYTRWTKTGGIPSHSRSIEAFRMVRCVSCVKPVVGKWRVAIWGAVAGGDVQVVGRQTTVNDRGRRKDGKTRFNTGGNFEKLKVPEQQPQPSPPSFLNISNKANFCDCHQRRAIRASESACQHTNWLIASGIITVIPAEAVAEETRPTTDCRYAGISPSQISHKNSPFDEPQPAITRNTPASW